MAAAGTQRAPAEVPIQAVSEPGVGVTSATKNAAKNAAPAAAKNTADRAQQPPPEPEPAENAIAEAAPAPAPATKLNLTLEQLGEGDHWAACIAQSGLSGVARELMMNMVPESVSGHTLRLTLDADHGHLRSDARVKKIERQLAERLALPLELEVRVGQLGAGGADGTDGGQSGQGGQAGTSVAETPSRRQERGRQEKQQAAEQAFQHDPKVQELVDLFDGEIVGDSIRPPAG